ncbi:calcium/sodium antiporter [Nitriliruptor alkaliphilus]|uniref:calcium/sodium antiporter n=1 Tax=Nitriliruptor alkaliphilus TaxID=427918 RepID=UPI0006991F03|nr:calcium/sodium antiporter [Nitriliruptor alkaliphilus]
MALSVLAIVVGLAVLTYASDQFVVGAARVARNLRLSPILIGAVVIGFGTSAPEMLVSGIAGVQGSLDIGVGNIIGSNVANLSLVLGVAALVTPIVVRSTVLKREAPIALGATVLFAIVVQGGLAGGEAVILTVALVIGLGLIILGARGGDDTISAEVDEFLTDEARTGREVVRTLLGLAFTLGAAQILVDAARNIASELGLAEGFVGLTIVAIGTSLPELATAVQAARKGETDLIVGNLLGSNLFNAGAVGAVAGFLGPGMLDDPNLTGLAVYLMVGIAVLATVFMVTGRRVARPEGAALLVLYLGAIPFLA